MPGRLVMNGVQREFMFHKPAGWRYWLKRRWDNPAGPQGLPLLVAYPEGYVTDRLGGRRPEDPEHFQLRWPFANLWEPESPFVPRPDDLPGATHHLDDQFFILVPFPYGWFDLPKTDRNDAVSVPSGGAPQKLRRRPERTLRPDVVAPPRIDRRHGWYRALEGTFLGGCLFTGRTAGRSAASML